MDNKKSYTPDEITRLLSIVSPPSMERTGRSMLLALRVCSELKELGYSVEQLREISASIECQYHRLDLNGWKKE